MRLRDASASRIEATKGSDQARVDAYFETEAQTWDEIYEGADVYSVIHQLRLRTALSLVDDLGLSPDSHVLDLGCGAGVCTLELARRGFEVDAVDTVESMVDTARSKAAAAGLGDRIRVGVGDAHELDFEDESFDLVLALGVVSWLHDPSGGLAEVSRILKRGGHFVANVDNHARLPYFIDPMRLPILDRPRRAVKRLLERKGLIQRLPAARQYWPRQFDSLLSSAGLRKRKGLTYGFGVFTFLGRPALPEAVGLRLHARLQAAADRGVRGIRSAGAQYMVVSDKPRRS